MELKNLQLAEVKEPSHQLREMISEEGMEELKRSIAREGLLNPIRVKQRESGYEIESGHRRYIALQELGWKEAPFLVVGGSDERIRIRAIHENLHREDMSPMEEARSLEILIKTGGYDRKGVARLCSKSEGWVESRLGLLTMPESIQKAVDVGAISMGAARELAAIGDEEAREYYLEYAIKQGATTQLCGFWRSRWEMEKITRSPSDAGSGGQLLNPPPMVVELCCAWCEHSYPINLFNHLRVCPKCTELIMKAREIEKQERLDNLRAAEPDAL
jgi:ParB/RepB/Spo0J family partition protein